MTNLSLQYHNKFIWVIHYRSCEIFKEAVVTSRIKTFTASLSCCLSHPRWKWHWNFTDISPEFQWYSEISVIFTSLTEISLIFHQNFYDIAKYQWYFTSLTEISLIFHQNFSDSKISAIFSSLTEIPENYNYMSLKF